MILSINAHEFPIWTSNFTSQTGWIQWQPKRTRIPVDPNHDSTSGCVSKHKTMDSLDPHATDLLPLQEELSRFDGSITQLYHPREAAC